MKRLALHIVTLICWLGSLTAQQTFPLQMEGEYLCEIRYGCAAPFKLIIQRDSMDATRFNFIDSCPNNFGGTTLCKMFSNSSTNSNQFLINTPSCFFNGEFFPNTDSLFGDRRGLGCGSGCNCVLLYKCKKVIPVGSAENKLEKLQLQPNPVRERLQVKYFNGQLQFTIYNSLGALSTSGQLTETNNQIEVLNLPKGIYFVQFDQDGVQYTQKFVKE